uniref:Uncharacterized protein n=1 Tax=Octopus bimaculoides TaxID=37653 RepID=A0A0L8FYT7_OCTBM
MAKASVSMYLGLRSDLPLLLLFLLYFNVIFCFKYNFLSSFHFCHFLPCRFSAFYKYSSSAAGSSLLFCFQSVS